LFIWSIEKRYWCRVELVGMVVLAFVERSMFLLAGLMVAMVVMVAVSS